MIPKIDKVETVKLVTLNCGCSFVVQGDHIWLLGPGMYCSQQPCSENTVRQLLKQGDS